MPSTRKADFLLLHYQRMDILFARDVFYASTFRKPCADTGLNDMPRVHFGQRPIPDFDLDAYVRKLFPGVDGGPPLLGAVCRTETIFQDHTELNIARPVLLSGEELFSLAIPSGSDVRSHNLSEFRPLPFNLRATLDKHGIRAVRFEGEFIQYFCDARVFISACVTEHIQRSC